MRGECQLENIQIKNVRSLKNTGKVSLPNITILVGENSSGKSTFLRVFPLLKQSISKRTDGPILWAGDADDYVDFGSFTETVTNDDSNTMEFSFQFPLTYTPETHLYPFSSLTKDFTHKYDIIYNFTISHHEGKDFVSKLMLCLDSSVFEFDFDSKTNRKGTSIIVDGIKLQNTTVKEEVYTLPYRGSDFSSIFEFQLPNITGLRNQLASLFSDAFDMTLDSTQKQQMAYDQVKRMIVDEYILMLGEYLCHNFSFEQILTNIKKRGTSKSRAKSSGFTDTVDLMLKQLLQQEPEKQRFHCAILKLCHFYSCFAQIEKYLNSYFRQVHYIAPLRATAERYYRLRNLAIDEVDYQGKNLSVFLNGLSWERLDSFQRWTQKYFGFKVVVEKDGGHLSVKVALGEDGNSINLSDTGFGYSQILPIITQLWDLSTRKNSNRKSPIPLVIAVEQPELHLHPAVQARLAKAFIASIKLAADNGYKLQLLLETHSQTIVNQFGLAIANGELEPKDVSVVLFEKPLGRLDTIVRTSHYDTFGYLQDWPIGFFAPGV